MSLSEVLTVTTRVLSIVTTVIRQFHIKTIIETSTWDSQHCTCGVIFVFSLPLIFYPLLYIRAIYILYTQCPGQ